MAWMKSLVCPPLRSRTSSTSCRSPGTKRSWPMRRSGPLGTSRIPVASTTRTPGWPSANRAYQSSTSGVTRPSSVARHGTIAGTHVRDSATQPRPSRTGENQREAAASSRLGQRTGGSGCLTRLGAVDARLGLGMAFQHGAHALVEEELAVALGEVVDVAALDEAQ